MSLTDAAPTRIALVWRVERDDADIQELVGVVRGRTARSSRRDGDDEDAAAPAKATAKAKANAKAAAAEQAKGGKSGKGAKGGKAGGASRAGGRASTTRSGRSARKRGGRSR